MPANEYGAGPVAQRGLLIEHQRLATQGARAVVPFTSRGQLYLAVPQLAADITHQPAYMNGGDSNIDMPVYRWDNGRFAEDFSLPVPGGEDALYFQIGTDEFLATASVRTGAGPYDLNATSRLYRLADAGWKPFQSFPSFAAKQWHFFHCAGRIFLALAQGVAIEGVEARNPRCSCLYEWDGSGFVAFQQLDGQWGYNWAYYEIGGRKLLGYADHAGVSRLLIWSGNGFEPFQDLSPQGGRAFQFFEADGDTWLAFANLTGDTVLYRWASDRFSLWQTLSGPGGREFAIMRTATALYLIQINFLHGSPAAPKTDLLSRIYRWENRQMVLVEAFATFGATSAAPFAADGQMFLAVSNSLSPDIRFRQDSVIYRFTG